MRRLYLIIAIAVLYSNPLFSQDFAIGLKNGVSWSNINGGYDFKCFSKTQVQKQIGHGFGLMVNYNATKYLSLYLELDVDEKGFDFQNDIWLDGGAYSGSFNLRYLNIPVISSFEIGHKIKYFGYAGMYLGFLIEATNYTKFSSTSNPDLMPSDLSYDPTDVFNNYEFGGLIGVGTKIPLCDKVKFLIDFRYNFGMTQAAKNTDYDYDSNQWTIDTPDNFQDVYNRSFSIHVGILYRLSGSELQGVASKEK